jgi:Uma2 family endonuclease
VRYFATLVPDLVVEVKSQSDRLKKLRDKIQVYIQQGVKVAILIDPDTCQLEVYRPDQPVIILGNGDILTVSELLPGWELIVAEIWPPVFDEDE